MFLFKRGSIYPIEYQDETENRVRRISTKCKSKKDALNFLSSFKHRIKTSSKLKFISLNRFSNEYQKYVNTNFSKSYLSQ